MALGNPKGTRDFSPKQLAKREHIQNCIENIYKSYGFMKIETPAFEHLETLTGKYGDEGEKLLFKILNSGDFLAKVDEHHLQGKNSQKIAPQISKKGLRYDLTVPFARYVAQHQNDIVFPFKRYQIQNVYRADRPQKGRYQEFLQCDADVIGTNSLLPEIEFIKIFHAIFSSLQLFDYEIAINHRKLLEAMAKHLKIEKQFIPFTVLLDKLDKIPFQKLEENFSNLGIQASDMNTLESWMQKRSFNAMELSQLSDLMQKSTALEEALEELILIANHTDNQNITLHLGLARGLDYYTGCIFEAKIPKSGVGSLSGGGRYDNLSDAFGLKQMSGVGISFGLDRISDVMDEKKLWTPLHQESTRVLITPLDKSVWKETLKIADTLREQNISTEIYPDHKKLKKQLEYAHKRKIPFVLTVGKEEIDQNKWGLKDMDSGRQKLVSTEDLIKSIQTKN